MTGGRGRAIVLFPDLLKYTVDVIGRPVCLHLPKEVVGVVAGSVAAVHEREAAKAKAIVDLTTEGVAEDLIRGLDVLHAV